MIVFRTVNYILRCKVTKKKGYYKYFGTKKLPKANWEFTLGKRRVYLK